MYRGLTRGRTALSAALGLCIVIVGCQIADAGARENALAYLEACKTSDWGALYELDYLAQREKAAIRNSRPQVLWDKLFSESKEAFVRQKREEAADRSDLERMLALQPHTEVLEIRPPIPSPGEQRGETIAFVQLRYSDPFNSPLRGGGPNNRMGLVQSAIAGIHMDSATGSVFSVQVLGDGIEFWPISPFLLISVSYRGAGQINLFTVGGVPPLSATVQCGVHTGSAGGGGPGERRMEVTLPVFGGDCTVHAQDASGAKDSVSFTLRERERPQGSLGLVTATLTVDWFGREPWFSAGFGEILFDSPRASISALTSE